MPEEEFSNNENVRVSPKVTIVIVSWNSMRYIMDCLESIMRQTYRDLSVIVIDNGSDDGTVNFIKQYYPTVSVLKNFKNLGFAKANNQGIKLAKSKYVLIMNPDVILNEDFLQNLIGFAETQPRGGAFAGKILKLFTEDIDPTEKGGELKEFIKSDKIDSTGLKIFKNRRVINRGEGQTDVGQFEKAEEVFGASGACALYRREALEETKIRNEYFDQDFFAYKEDIDLSWRLRLYGWQIWYVANAIAYHHRRFSGQLKEKWFKVPKSRRGISRLLRKLSFKNQHLTLVKNEIVKNLLFHFIPFFWREIKILIYSLIFEPFLIKSVTKFFQQLPLALIKRRVIMAHKKISAKEIRKWFA